MHMYKAAGIQMELVHTTAHLCHAQFHPSGCDIHVGATDMGFMYYIDFHTAVQLHRCTPYNGTLS